MVLLIILTLINAIKSPHVAEEHIDMIELNHFYDHAGRHVYDQLIFWEKWPHNGIFHVRAWTLIHYKEEDKYPTNNQKGLWEVLYYDTEAKLYRKLVTRIYKESWTQTDPERADKKYLDEADRIGLIQNKPTKRKTIEP